MEELGRNAYVKLEQNIHLITNAKVVNKGTYKYSFDLVIIISRITTT